ncbi:MAG: hydantoinase/oxoprolinase family protein [Chloroflexi bacterium]|nr:hydantoinase/oxoprolinase family protein [Chloroflexota bacterium]
MTYVIGVDIGGTFTDTVVVDDAGRAEFGKSLSTPSDFTGGILNSLAVAAERIGITTARLLEDTRLFLHSTTIAENAIVDGALAKSGLLVTRGFENTLYMMRGGYGRWSGLSDDEKKDPIYQDKPPPLVPVRMTRGIRERTDTNGRVLVRPAENEVRAAVGDLIRHGAESVGVSFLWSFRNAENENTVRRIIKQAFPGLFFSISSEIAPIMGEYERTSTVALNVGLGPMVSKYLDNLQKRLKENGFSGKMLIMQAYGGLLAAEECSSRCVGLIESGPVSGLVGTKLLGKRMSHSNVIAIDIGGTTFKVGVINEGAIEYQREPMVLRYHYALPKMDVVSLGVAGGSIVSLDTRTNMPRVGPQSAGASPGPLCYGFGGREPTLTDVDLILGYLNSEFFLGGHMKLRTEDTLRTFKKKIADPLGMDVMQAAGAISRLANSLIYDLLHKVTVSRGLDPREYMLFSYGGTAGMHAADIAEELGVKGVVIPHSASVHGAFGLVSADVIYEDQYTQPMQVPVKPAEINSIFARLTDRVKAQLKSSDFVEDNILVRRSIDMRFRRQVHLVTTPVETAGDLDETELAGINELFISLYQNRYGKDSAFREAGIELVTFRVRGVGLLRKPESRGEPRGPAVPDRAFLGTRQAYFKKARRSLEARTYDYVKLHPGNRIEGPAIIWTPITTIVVNPGQKAFCDSYKNILITWSARGLNGNG